MKKEFWSEPEARTNIHKYCALQERCHQEVRHTLLEHGIYGDLLEEIISDLISNDFLNEERFAASFARGKFRIKNWGKKKIIYELKLRDVSDYSIREALKEIDEMEYLQTLNKIIDKKNKSSSYSNPYERIKKITDYALAKGYEYELIQEVLKKKQG